MRAVGPEPEMSVPRKPVVGQNPPESEEGRVRAGWRI